MSSHRGIIGKSFGKTSEIHFIWNNGILVLSKGNTYNQRNKMFLVFFMILNRIQPSTTRIWI